MKKLWTCLLASALAVSLFAGCSSPNGQQPSQTGAPGEEPSESLDVSEPEGDLPDGPPTILIRVGASPTPHGEILAKASEQLLEDGYEIQVVEFTDYVQPNLALDSGELDANFFQHKPYLDEFCQERNVKLSSVAAIHYEPLGLYAGKTASVDALPNGASIAVPNDTTNEARALLLLQEQGLITLREGAGITATQADIEENPKNLKIQEIAPEQLPRSLEDVDMAVINGNYAILGGLKVGDALAKEEEDSLAAQTYANVVAVRQGEEERAEIQALIKALQSDEVKQFITEKYEGAVIAVN